MRTATLRTEARTALAVFTITSILAGCDTLVPGSDSPVPPVDQADEHESPSDDTGIAGVMDYEEGPYVGQDDPDQPDHYTIDRDSLWPKLRSMGIEPTAVSYLDMVPYDPDGDNEFDLVFGAIQAPEDGELTVTFISPETGEVLERRSDLHEGLRAFITEFHLDRVDTVPAEIDAPPGSSVGSYESFPWGWNLPFCSKEYVSQGYSGHGYYATDWNLKGSKDCGNILAAPHSGFVTGAGWYSSGYGNVVVTAGNSAGSGRRYISRVAHLESVSVRPGWWVAQGSTLGKIGTTGRSTGCHIHFEAWRGTASGGSISGEKLPINGWPSSSSNIDGYNGAVGSGSCFRSGNSCSSGDTCP